jgi:flagellar biosynthetic protein FlhB
MTESADKDQRTEFPTSKRIEEAREEGNLAVSREVSTWATFVAGLMVLGWFGPFLGRQMLVSLRVFLERPEQVSLEDGGLQNVLLGVLSSVGLSATLVFGVVLMGGTLGTMVQTDFYINPSRVELNAQRVFSLQGFKRLFSTDSLADLVRSFLKLVVMGYVVYRIMKPVVMEAEDLVGRELMSGMSYLHDEAMHLLIVLLVIITAIAVADWIYTRFQYFKSLRMTKQEVKDEHKQMEGDPMIKGRLRRIRLEKARRRMMAKVPEADVVITNPTHYAVALKYDNAKMDAPVLLAKGLDKLAERIRDMADENEIPIVSNPPLCRALYDTVELDEPIQPEHYRAVAEVISYVYKLKKKLVK